jgi:hypothetical protein
MRSDAECEQEFISKALSRIAGHTGVFGLLVVHPSSGRVLHQAGFGDDAAVAKKWKEEMLSFVAVAASTVRTLDHSDDLTFLRMQWMRRHVVVCPDPNREYTIVCVQNLDPAAAAAAASAAIEGSAAAAAPVPPAATPAAATSTGAAAAAVASASTGH